MLQAQDIHFCIRSMPIINKASISLAPGELTVILGPNGAGKSTLFKVLAGEIPCKYGKVVYNGFPISGFSAKNLALVRAVMPQHSSLSFPFKALEVVELGLLASGNSYRPDLVEEVMEETQTLHLKEKLYGDLSGGEKQRVQLARVLTQIWDKKPFSRYLLLDEPTSSMDIALQHHVLRIIHKIKKRNIGVLAILHDLNLAANYADKIILLKKGSIIHQGPVNEVMTSAQLEQVFEHPIQVFSGSDKNPMIIQSIPFIQNHLEIKLA
ncbi:heme ABC transporter ATP-binding protein [Aquiflexum gelatinilyticum]|uniref:Heme ABC transporter ATP-binding protein n=1 Tax=Aquiflexum gelatinilyticum TaxID=2961943 RepID=A0A9X2P3G6_9BACT|nr:heme ABC transporter ATP-binding protein [Aquiflexum gelatinilyticum]MCR9015098.1 heme ABC transporter ATP-binding protein [Aquiflexum gelatinilyticum]